MTEGPAPVGSPAEPPVSGVLELRRRALALGFGVIALTLLVLMMVIYAPVLRPMLWAAALATLFFPLHRRVLKLVKGRERVAALLTTGITVATFAVPAFFFVTKFVTEAQNLWPEIRATLGTDAFQRLAVWLEQSGLRPVLVWLLPGQVQLGPEGLEDSLRQAVSGFGELAVNQLRELGRNAPSTAVGAAMTLVTYFFFLRHGPGWLTTLENALPLERHHAASLLRIAGRTINAVFRGVVITAMVQGFLAGVGFAFAGVPVPVVLGAITMIAALIPFVGPVAVWLPVTIGLFLTDRTGAGIALLAWGTLVVSLVDNFLRPYLIGKETRLPILWLFLAILGGLRAFGFLGLLLGPAALSLFLACYRIYTEGRRSEPSTPAAANR